jgi:hypothetical protein
MPLILINGISRDATEAEIAAKAAEDAAFAALPPPVPFSVSRFQAKAALSDAGLLASAQSIVDAADASVKMAWDEAVEFRRNSPTINALAGALGIDSDGLDDLFRAAALIEA